MGLAWKVVPELELLTEAEAVCRRIAALPEQAVRDLKRVINRACHLDVEGAMELETEVTVRAFSRSRHGSSSLLKTETRARKGVGKLKVEPGPLDIFSADLFSGRTALDHRGRQRDWPSR